MRFLPQFTRLVGSVARNDCWRVLVAMQVIEPRVTEKEARRYFERRRAGNLWGLLNLHKSAKGPPGSTKPEKPRVDLVWLPHYYIRFRVVSRLGPGEIAVSVEAHSGSFAIFQMEENLVDREIEGEVFEPRLSIDRATEIGRRDLVKSILRQRGQWNKPEVQEALEPDLFYYPFWVYYYERRRGLFDIQVYDAARGVKGGPRTKVGILSGLVGSNEAARKVLENGRQLEPL